MHRVTVFKHNKVSYINKVIDRTNTACTNLSLIHSGDGPILTFFHNACNIPCAKLLVLNLNIKH